MTDHKTMTAHIRKRLKAEGIKARVRMCKACGVRSIQVIVPSYESRFTADEIEMIAFICKVNGLTGARRSEIDPQHERLLTGKHQWEFEFHD